MYSTCPSHVSTEWKNHISVSSLNAGIISVRTWSFLRTVSFNVLGVGARELQVVLDVFGVRAAVPDEMEPLLVGFGLPLADGDGDIVREKVMEDKSVQDCRYQQDDYCQGSHEREKHRDRLGHHIGHFVGITYRRDGCTGHRERVGPPCQWEPVRWKFQNGKRVD